MESKSKAGWIEKVDASSADRLAGRGGTRRAEIAADAPLQLSGSRRVIYIYMAHRVARAQHRDNQCRISTVVLSFDSCYEWKQNLAGSR